MSHHYHAILWIDHHEARILEFNAEERDAADIVKPRHPVKQLHTKAGTLSSWRAVEDPAYFDEIAKHLEGLGEVLVVGPANAKLAFVKHTESKHRELADRIVGIETVDHPSDGELVNYARSYFGKLDRTLPQIG